MRVSETSAAGPGIVVLNWSSAAHGLLDELARTMAARGLHKVTCVGEVEALAQPPAGLELIALAHDPEASSEVLVERLRTLDIAAAQAVIVLPRSGLDDPDSSSRLTCAAIRKACGGKVGPNVLVEIEDPEAAFEFVGLDVATVFYSGHLRAALLGQACVDLGVFEFVVGLLRGRHHVRTLALPEHLRSKTFADAALELELDERGRPMTVIGITRKPAADAPRMGDHVQVNPGPRTPLREVLGLLVLISGDEELAA